MHVLKNGRSAAALRPYGKDPGKTRGTAVCSAKANSYKSPSESAVPNGRRVRRRVDPARRRGG